MTDSIPGLKSEDQEFQQWVAKTVQAIFVLSKEREDVRDFVVVMGIVVGAYIHQWPEADRETCLKHHTELVRTIMNAGPDQTGLEAGQ